MRIDPCPLMCINGKNRGSTGHTKTNSRSYLKSSSAACSDAARSVMESVCTHSSGSVIDANTSSKLGDRPMPTVNDAYADILHRLDQALANMTPNEQSTLVMRLGMALHNRETVLLATEDR